MPEPTDEELGLDEEQTEGLDPNIRAELRKSRILARENAELKEQSAKAQREAAFAKAGVPDTPLHTQLASTYQGENDPASVRAFFENLGVDLSGKQAAQQEQSNEAELDQQRQLAQVGSQGGQGGDVRFEDAIKSAKSVDEVMSLLAAAPEGATDHDGRRIGIPRIE